jgi:radical SAM superfamily enzyme YgiQ (UPF0313 family)
LISHLALGISHLANILLISTYDLGRQPFGLASPAAWLRRGGHTVRCMDLTRTKLSEDAVRSASLVAFYLPMHTATRMALSVIERVRALNPSAHLCAYGLYAPLNVETLREHGAQTILGPEFEPDLVRLAASLDSGELVHGLPMFDRPLSPGASLNPSLPGGVRRADIPRVAFITPDRSDLPSLTTYASLQIGGDRRVVWYTEATRGCKHRCRHCPIVPVYDGRFRAVPAEVVLADVRAQVAAGAQHITFGDPDFFNGPTHALTIVNALARECPGCSYDVTIKVEHLKQHAALLPALRDTGCAFVTSAVESFEDEVLAKLEKGHTHADFVAVVEHCASIGLTLSPTFVAFTPWTTIESYWKMLQEIVRLGLVPAVSPIQYAIRLLIPEGSRMLELADVRARIERFDPKSLTHVWRHVDSRVDALQRELERLVGSRLNAPRGEMFLQVREIAQRVAGRPVTPLEPLPSRATIPYLNEPWYC